MAKEDWIQIKNSAAMIPCCVTVKIGKRHFFDIPHLEGSKWCWRKQEQEIKKERTR